MSRGSCRGKSRLSGLPGDLLLTAYILADGDETAAQVLSVLKLSPPIKLESFGPAGTFKNRNHKRNNNCDIKKKTLYS